MQTTLIRIAIAALLSLSSLFVVLFRVSPLTVPALAVPLFFVTFFLSIATSATLLTFFVWHRLAIEGMDIGRRLSIALREGIFIAMIASLLIGLQILGVLTWWIALLICCIFFFVELALHS